MEFKDILVHVDNSEQSATRLDLAITLAKEHKAHLTGLFVITHTGLLEAKHVLSQAPQEPGKYFF